jgi:hypothetical protein
MGDAHILVDVTSWSTRTADPLRYPVRGAARISGDHDKQPVHARHELFALGGRAGRKRYAGETVIYSL